MRKTGWIAGVVLILGLLTLGSEPAGARTRQAAHRPSGSLTAFHSTAELKKFLKARHIGEPVPLPPPPSPPPPVEYAPPAPGEASPPVSVTAQAEASSADSLVLTGSRAPDPKITNTQEADVDEGGIVKVHGDFLVILRRGRLFTVSLAGGGMRAVDSIDAFPPGVNAQGDWYDEMLLSGDRVVVVGYSYDRGGTEINRFRLDPAGHLRWEDAYHLRSDDYYSDRNYASRLIGNRLIFYSPLPLEWNDDPLEILPGIRRWQKPANDDDDDDDRPFTPIATASRIYIPNLLRRDRTTTIDTLHSVTTCDLTAPVLDCSAVGVLGPESRSFYVTSDAVYLWISDAWQEGRPRGAASFVYRLPFGGRERPSAVRARGGPVDQFSFREDRQDGVLNVLLRSEGGDDAMWRPEVSEGDVALLRLPIYEFGDGSGEADLADYRPLPKPGRDGWNFHNRFVGPYVLYGGGSGDSDERRYTVVAAPVRGGQVSQLDIGHGADRIEILGRDAIVVGGGDKYLGFTTVELPPLGAPRLGDLFRLPDAAEGESRSHAFFFSPDPATPDGASGMLGLPVNRDLPERESRFLGSAASMLFLRRTDRRLSPAGELGARAEEAVDDGCQASCVDWYGNARPIFLGSRTFALLGYELVEGAFAPGAPVREVARLNFAPPSKPKPD